MSAAVSDIIARRIQEDAPYGDGFRITPDLFRSIQQSFTDTPRSGAKLSDRGLANVILERLRVAEHQARSFDFIRISPDALTAIQNEFRHAQRAMPPLTILDRVIAEVARHSGDPVRRPYQDDYCVISREDLDGISEVFSDDLVPGNTVTERRLAQGILLRLRGVCGREGDGFRITSAALDRLRSVYGNDPIPVNADSAEHTELEFLRTRVETLERQLAAVHAALDLE